MRQHSIGGVADRLAPSRWDVSRCRVFTMQVADGCRVVSRPGVPHRGGRVKQIARVNRWRGEIDPNRGEVLSVPDSRDGLRPQVWRQYRGYPRKHGDPTKGFQHHGNRFVKGMGRRQSSSAIVRFSLALRTAVSTICCPMRAVSTDRGPSTGTPVSRQWRKYCTGLAKGASSGAAGIS